MLRPNQYTSKRHTVTTYKIMAEIHDKIAHRGRITGMKEAGHSTAELCRELGVSHTTVDKWWRRRRTEGNLLDQPKSGAHLTSNISLNLGSLA